MERADIISRIQKLSRLTIAAGATEAEAALAAAKIADLMREYNISQSETEVRREATHCETGAYTEFGSGSRDWMYCARAIGKTFDCISFCINGNLDGLFDTVSVKFFGLPADVNACVSMLGICANAMTNECEKYMASAGRGQGRSGAHSFRMGMAGRLSQRIAELRPMPVGSALIVLKRDLVKAEWEKVGIKLTVRSTTTIKNSGAYTAGKAAADRVDIGGGKISGSSRLIGRA